MANTMVGSPDDDDGEELPEELARNAESVARALEGLNLDYSRLFKSPGFSAMSRNIIETARTYEVLRVSTQQTQAFQAIAAKIAPQALGFRTLKLPPSIGKSAVAAAVFQGAIRPQTWTALQSLHGALGLQVSQSQLLSQFDLLSRAEVSEPVLEQMDTAVGEDAPLNTAVESAAEALTNEQPGLSHAAARRRVVGYMYVLSLTVISWILVVNPVLGGILLAASGINAKDADAAAGKLFDRIAGENEPDDTDQPDDT
jgi:hypothetical protein